MKIAKYNTDLTDGSMGLSGAAAAQASSAWTPADGPAAHHQCDLYMINGGIQWWLLPATFPPRQAVVGTKARRSDVLQGKNG